MSVPQACGADIKLLAKALLEAKAPVVFGLLNISMESQRLALRLVRTLGAYVSLERPAFASLTYGTLKKFKLLLNCTGQEIPAALRSLCGEPVCTDALFGVNAWRYLRALKHNKHIPNLVDDALASELDGIFNRMVGAGGAAILIGVPAVSPMVYDQIRKFEDESSGALELGVIQLSGTNLAGAFEVALEEFWGAPASLCGGKPKIDEAFNIKKLSAAGAIDAALLIGDFGSWPFPDEGLGCPLYAVGSKETLPQTPAILIPTARMGEDDGGTILRDDWMPLTIEPGTASNLPKLTEVLSALIEEGSAC